MDTVVFTVCRRPWYLEKVLQSWSTVRGVQDWRLVFMIEPTERTRESVAVIDKFRHRNKQLVFNAAQLGVLVNPYEGLKKSFESGAVFTVLAEEDIVVSDDVLEFFVEARKFATMDTLAVCAHSTESEGAAQSVLVRSGKFSPWVWGTDIRMWTEYLEPTWDKDYSSGEGGAEAGWDWNIQKRVLPKMGGHVISPAASRSQNIGEFGGTHQIPADFPGTKVGSFQPSRKGCRYELRAAGL